MASLLHDFGSNKTEHLKRSTWLTSLKNKTAMAQGVLVPLGWYDVIPNSDIECNVDELIKLALTPKHPFFADMYFTYGAYFVPYRVLYQRYPEMFGNGKPSEWSNPSEYVMPMGNYDNTTTTTTSSGTGYDAVVNTSVLQSGSGVIVSKVGNLADYLGLPLCGQSGGSMNVNIAPFLAYERIWSDYWRDENYQNIDPDLEKAYTLGSGSLAVNNFRFCLHYANKFHDYLTSVLPDVCKGAVPQADLPLKTFSSLTALNGTLKVGTGSSGTTAVNGTLWSNTQSGVGINSASGSVGNLVTGTNLGVSINPVQLRTAFALLRASERNARTGSRAMNEAMKGIFEAQAPAILDKAEFLGGNTISLNLMSVPQTGDNAGKLGAFSSTLANTGAFKRTFDEPGLIMIVGAVRMKHSYPQSIARYWRKSRRYDFYDPALAHISEQPVYKHELSIVHDDGPNDVYGFQEPWVEYEKPVNLITGYLRDASNADLSAWAPQHKFAGGDILNPAIDYLEDGNEIAKACIDYNANFNSYQFIVDFTANLKVTAPKPVYSIPGYIDHLIA